jgi:hypothetical protein
MHVPSSRVVCDDSGTPLTPLTLVLACSLQDLYLHRYFCGDRGPIRAYYGTQAPGGSGPLPRMAMTRCIAQARPAAHPALAPNLALQRYGRLRRDRRNETTPGHRK